VREADGLRIKSHDKGNLSESGILAAFVQVRWAADFEFDMYLERL
jgi:hypothetical protein